MTNSGETQFSDQLISFPDHLEESNHPNLPLLQSPSNTRSKPSLISDELSHFRISLKWSALDHSSDTGKFISYFTFSLLTIIVPLVTSLAVHVPAESPADDPSSLNKLVQLPESALAAIAFSTLSRFFHKYTLRQLLFFDDLNDDSLHVRHRYTGELDKAFKYLACILLPSFFVEIAHKILFFSTVTVSVPWVSSGVFPVNSIVFILVVGSWVYRTGVFLLVCVLFRLTCELQILRFEGFRKTLEEGGSDTGRIFREHVRIRKQLSVTSHRYRFFIIVCLVTITVSQLGGLMLVLASKSEKSFFNSGDLVVCSAVQLSGFFLFLMGAARITHRAQGIVSVATRWHMLATCSSNAESDQFKDIMTPAEGTQPPSKCGGTHDSESSEIFIPMSSHDSPSFQTRQALLTYLQHNNGGITVFGFALDRGLLHTLFAFEFSLVMWILSKVVVLSR